MNQHSKWDPRHSNWDTNLTIDPKYNPEIRPRTWPRHPNLDTIYQSRIQLINPRYHLDTWIETWPPNEDPISTPDAGSNFQIRTQFDFQSKIKLLNWKSTPTFESRPNHTHLGTWISNWDWIFLKKFFKKYFLFFVGGDRGVRLVVGLKNKIFKI